MLPLLVTISPCLASAEESAALNEVPEPKGVVTLAAACAAALAGSPALEGFSWEMRASEARLLQAGLRRNPTLDTTLEDVAGTGGYGGFKEAQTTILLGQVIELGGKRAARREVAAVSRDLTAAQYELARVDVLANVAEKFIALLAVQHEMDLARDSTRLAGSALITVREQIKGGKNSAIEEKKALVAVSRQRLVSEHAEHEFASARVNLAATWGSTEPHFERAEGALFTIPKIPSFDELAPKVQSSPEVARFATEERLRAAEVALALSERIPNLSLSGGYRRLSGPEANSLVFGFSVPLPLFDRNQGNTAAALASQSAAAADSRSAAVRLHSTVFELYQELRHAAVALEQLEREILPQAKAAFALSELGFREGRFSWLELLDAQRTFVDLQRERIEMASKYQRNLLAIERLLGQSLTDFSAFGHDTKR